VREVIENGAGAPALWHKSPLVRFALWAVGGAVVGYGVGWAIAEYEDSVPALKSATDWLKAQSGLELIAGLIVLMMIMLGLWMLYLGATTDNRLRGLMKMEADDNPARMRRMLPIGGWGMLFYAAVILIFLLPGIPPAIGIAIGAACFAAITWLFYRGTALMDELEQAAQREAIIATFIIIEALGIGWALLHHYGLAPALAPLAVVLLMTVIYYLAGAISSFRRGLAR
jgi:hypothetical protein